MNIDDLSPELREKVRACGTPEDLLELAKEEGMEISDEELDGISGGWSPGIKCPDFGKNCSGYQSCGPVLRW